MHGLFLALLSFFALTNSVKVSTTTCQSIDVEVENIQVNQTLPLTRVSNNCISFQVSQGTGCTWMCSYCANQLGTYNYYFTNDVCTYQTGGCVGNPQTGVTYTCCSV
jgi:hypothetical protein